MNLKTFNYCVLKYCPSHALGEQVNIGILLLFKESDTARFIFPTNLSRLVALFPAVDINTLEKYLTNLRTKIEVLTEGTNIMSQLTPKEFIATKVLVPDSNSLYFDELRTSKYDTIDATKEHYYNMYFDSYC